MQPFHLQLQQPTRVVAAVYLGKGTRDRVGSHVRERGGPPQGGSAAQVDSL